MFKPTVHPKIPITNVLFAMLFLLAVEQSSAQAYNDSIAIAIAGEVNCGDRNYSGAIFPIEFRSILHRSIVVYDASCCGECSTVQYDTRKSIRNTLKREG